MMRITVQTRTPDEVVLEVTGWVSGAGVGVLEQEGGRWLQGGQRLVLDLAGVKFIDAAGLALLEDWSGGALVLRRGSWFIRRLLQTHGLESAA